VPTEKSENHTGFAAALLAALGQVPPRTDEEVREELEAWGIDPDGVGRRFQAAAERILGTGEPEWMDQARSDLARDRSELATATRPSDDRTGSLMRDETVNAILALRSRLPAGTAAALHYRELNDLSDEDLREQLRELQFLEAHLKDSGGNEEPH